ncbi:MAG: DNA repair protein RecN [Rothia sp. (in: high G+C Gram-positive bacteria)]|nr:DNA repair protein RecN [Rothia sp. (in: high G+C Gram-positive bacteria)]
MLEEIHLRDLGVISDARLPLGPGLSVLTGETGAGKTMVVTALGMLLGARSDAQAVRSGASKALAEAVVRLPQDHPALKIAEDAGGEVEDIDTDSCELLLARSVSAQGRSRAYVGGCTTPAAKLAEIGQQLVAVHGQSDQLRLKSAQQQRHALDSYAGGQLARVKKDYRASYERYRQVTELLGQVRENSRARALEAQSLQTALAEIDAVQPSPGEDTALKEEAARLSNAEGIRLALEEAATALSGSDYSQDAGANVVALLDKAGTALEREADSDAELSVLASRLREALIQVTDIKEELAAYGSSLDLQGPERLAEVETRRAQLRGLTRKYGADIAEVLAWAQESRSRLANLSDDPAREGALEEELVQLQEAMQLTAKKLYQLREKAGQKLARAVSQELSALAMPQASLVVAVKEAEKFGPEGKDTLTFLLQPYPQAQPRPLGKGASGGELSRVMLALEVVLAEVDPVATFIFDEVDSGVGGKAALEVGRRLARLAQHVQVLVVTHLPQVAAFADQHILVLKNDAASASKIKILDEQERVVELARMLAGHDQSASAREHARELLKEAGAVAAAGSRN